MLLSVADSDGPWRLLRSLWFFAEFGSGSLCALFGPSAPLVRLAPLVLRVDEPGVGYRTARDCAGLDRCPT